MKIGLLAPATGWHVDNLIAAAEQAHHEIFPLSFEELEAEAGQTETPFLSWPSRLDCLLARAMPAGSLQQVIFRMDVLIELERQGLPIINPPRTIETSVDKYLTMTRLQAAGIPIPPTSVSQTVATALRHFERLGSDVVVKPLFGSMGRGLKRIQSLDIAKPFFETLVADGQVIYQQAFIDHGGFDIRLLVIGETVLGMQRSNPDHWITNIAQGAIGSPHPPTPDETEIALRSARAVGAFFAGIDLLYDRATGQPYVLEINSSPAWRAIASVLDRDIAQLLLVSLEKAIG